MRELIHLGLELYYLCCPILLHLGAITNFCFFLLFEQEPLWPGMAVTALVFVLLSGTKKKTFQVNLITWKCACYHSNACHRQMHSPPKKLQLQVSSGV